MIERMWSISRMMTVGWKCSENIQSQCHCQPRIPHEFP